MEPAAGLLAPSDLASEGGGGGLFVVGSHVPRTTAQLSSLLSREGVSPVEVSVEALLDDGLRQERIRQAAEGAETILKAGRDAVIFTSRTLVEGKGTAAGLDVGRTVSDALADIVGRIQVRPRYLVAKGGITSSDIATLGLKVRRAWVLGQALPGVPVWRLGPETRYPGMAYVVFPGNVGDDEALSALQGALTGTRRRSP
jgi:uncharacterized protein YgbK (DUF1537 family)